MHKNEKILGNLLRDHGLKRTPIRMEILEVFMNNDVALSAKALLEKLPGSRDRVTIYRALTSFEENGILHVASEDQHGIRYALCGHQCSSEAHQDEHAHFLCDECQETYCLEGVKVPEVPVKNGFKVSNVHFMLNGICNNCQPVR